MKSTETISPSHEILARRLAATLNSPVGHDISERLRAARVRAVAARRVSPMVQVQSNGALTMAGGQDMLRPWGWLASSLPLLALVVGLVTIKHFQDERRANELADIDTALLIDDLPPSAYADPVFMRFLKMPLPLASEPEREAKPE